MDENTNLVAIESPKPTKRKPKYTRKNIPWHDIERDYRLGQLSIREIARSHNINASSLVRKAQREGWTRDFGAEIRARTKQALMNPTGDNVPTHEDIQKAVEANRRIIQLHRLDARQQLENVQRLMKIVEERLSNIDPNSKPDMNDLRFLGGVMRDCSQAMSKLVSIERQAYGIDDDPRQGEPVEEINISFVEAVSIEKH